jgi:hypothetical protein
VKRLLWILLAELLQKFFCKIFKRPCGFAAWSFCFVLGGSEDTMLL